MNIITSRARCIQALYNSLFSTPLHYHRQCRRYGNGGKESERVSVWWDFHDCGIPTGVNNLSFIVDKIKGALKCTGIWGGPVQITAFGDISTFNSKPFSRSGINLLNTSFNVGTTNTSDCPVVENLKFWASQNPPPSHIFWISGNRHFAQILHELRSSNYTILIASKEGQETPNILRSAASEIWEWDGLARGEQIGGYFQGKYKGPIESESEDEISPTEKFRSDCMLLVHALLDWDLEGFTINEFESSFLPRYGYELDPAKFGFTDVASLLSSLPGVLVESDRAFPDDELKAVIEDFQTSTTTDDDDAAAADDEAHKIVPLPTNNT